MPPYMGLGNKKVLLHIFPKSASVNILIKKNQGTTKSQQRPIFAFFRLLNRFSAFFSSRQKWTTEREETRLIWSDLDLETSGVHLAMKSVVIGVWFTASLDQKGCLDLSFVVSAPSLEVGEGLASFEKVKSD